MDSLFNMLDTNSNKFYFDESNKKKIIVYHVYKKYQDTYSSHIKKDDGALYCMLVMNDKRIAVGGSRGELIIYNSKK